MIARLAAILLLAATAGTASAQWLTTTYTLRPGWNAIWLHGDASHLTPAQAFASETRISEAWRWNNGSTGRQFSFNAANPSGGLPDWSYWSRNGTGNTLASLPGQTAYLVRNTHSANITFTLTARAMAPDVRWTRSGANFLGFPSRAAGSTPAFPTFQNFFASFSAGISGSPVFQYIGGNLSSANPRAIPSYSAERVDRLQAYWFEADVTNDFYGPYSISFKNGADLAFGLQRLTSTLLFRNRTSANLTLTVAPVNSEAAPAGQTQVAGPVPLTLRSFDPSTARWNETPLGASASIVVPPNSTAELPLGLARTAIQPGAFHASILRVTDSTNLTQVDLPVSATGDTNAGLWVGEATPTGVGSFVQGYAGTEISTLAPSLRLLLHVSGAGSANLLSQAFLGQRASDGADCVATNQAALKAENLPDAARFFAAHMPLDRVIACSGSTAAGSTLTAQIQIPFDDATNPLVHQYHPDHDNRSATGTALPAGRESANITRHLSLTFTADPPGATAGTGWGGNAIGGTYSETLTGLSKNPVTITGTFRLQKASSIPTLTQ